MSEIDRAPDRLPASTTDRFVTITKGCGPWWLLLPLILTVFVSIFVLGVTVHVR